MSQGNHEQQPGAPKCGHREGQATTETGSVWPLGLQAVGQAAGGGALLREPQMRLLCRPCIASCMPAATAVHRAGHLLARPAHAPLAPLPSLLAGGRTRATACGTASGGSTRSWPEPSAPTSGILASRRSRSTWLLPGWWAEPPLCLLGLPWLHARQAAAGTCIACDRADACAMSRPRRPCQAGQKSFTSEAVGARPSGVMRNGWLSGRLPCRLLVANLGAQARAVVDVPTECLWGVPGVVV